MGTPSESGTAAHHPAEFADPRIGISTRRRLRQASASRRDTDALRISRIHARVSRPMVEADPGTPPAGAAKAHWTLPFLGREKKVMWVLHSPTTCTRCNIKRN